MTKFYAAALASAALLALPVATPAFAQGSMSPVVRDNGCPKGWSSGTVTGGNASKRDPNMCYPSVSRANPPMVYHNPKRAPCASGYRQEYKYCTTEPAGDGISAADKLVSYGTITKVNRLDRCPLGYFSKSDMTTCTTTLSPAPASRRKAGACRANEIDEWGLYCTANASAITRQQAEDEAARDFNAIYSENGAKYPTQGDDTVNYPSMVAAYGRKGSGGGGAAASSSSSNSGNTASAPAANANCTTDTSSAGAALGGALGGQMGAALGGMMGGMAKKKPGC